MGLTFSFNQLCHSLLELIELNIRETSKILKHNYSPWHALVAIWPKMVIDNRDLHILVSNVSIIVSKKHNLVLISKPVVGDSYIGRTTSDINQSILTIIKGIVVNPYLRSCNQSDCISIYMAEMNYLPLMTHHCPRRLRFAMMDTEALNDYIGSLTTRKKQ